MNSKSGKIEKRPNFQKELSYRTREKILFVFI